MGGPVVARAAALQPLVLRGPMRAAVRKLGNSSGVIVPKSLLREIGVAAGNPIGMTLEAGRIVLIRVKRRARAGRAEASQSIAEAGDDALAWPEFGNTSTSTISTATASKSRRGSKPWPQLTARCLTIVRGRGA